MRIYSKQECPQGSELWHAIRRERLTASRMKEVVTSTGELSSQSEELAMEMSLYSIPGFKDPFEFAGDKHTDWGHQHEPEAREKFREIMRADVREVGFCEHSTGLMGCSPDGLIYSGGRLVSGLEIKCPKAQTLGKWMLEGVLPAEHKAQVHASMIVTGLSQWWFMAYFPDLKPFVIEVRRDAYTEAVEAAAAEFAVKLERTRRWVLANMKQQPEF